MAACRPPIPPLGCPFSFFLFTGLSCLPWVVCSLSFFFLLPVARSRSSVQGGVLLSPLALISLSPHVQYECMRWSLLWLGISLSNSIGAASGYMTVCGVQHTTLVTVTRALESSSKLWRWSPSRLWICPLLCPSLSMSQAHFSPCRATESPALALSAEEKRILQRHDTGLTGAHWH